MWKLIITAGLLVGLGVPAVFGVRHFTGSASNAGGLPTAPAAPARSAIARHGPATLTAAEALQRAMSHIGSDEIAHQLGAPSLSTFGAVTDLQIGHGQYAADYPIWVVSLAGTLRAESGPAGVAPANYTTETFYLDGYTGAVIERVLNAGTPTAEEAAARATSLAAIRARFLPTATPTP